MNVLVEKITASLGSNNASGCAASRSRPRTLRVAPSAGADMSKTFIIHVIAVALL